MHFVCISPVFYAHGAAKLYFKLLSVGNRKACISAFPSKYRLFESGGQRGIRIFLNSYFCLFIAFYNFRVEYLCGIELFLLKVISSIAIFFQLLKYNWHTYILLKCYYKSEDYNSYLLYFPFNSVSFSIALLQTFNAMYLKQMLYVSIDLTLTHISKKCLRNVSETSSYHNDII